MTLLVTVLAAIISSIVWYNVKKPGEKEPYKLISLVYMYWGASLMWLIDLIFSYVEDGSAIFVPEEGEELTFFFQQMNDLGLGLAVIVLGLVIWACIVLFSDPKGLIFKKK